MAIKKAEVEKVICDSCGTTYYHEKDEELPLGFYLWHGLQWIHGAGGSGTRSELYFCSQKCLVKFARTVTEYMD